MTKKSVSKTTRTSTKAPFNRDDRIKVITPRSKYLGKEGRVTSYSFKNNEVGVCLDGGTYTDFHPDSLEKVDTSVPTSPATKTIAYLRVSTADQYTAKNKADVLEFANDRPLWPCRFR